MFHKSLFLAFALTLAGGACHAQDLEVLVRQLAGQTLPEVDSKAPAIVLLDEATLTFDEGGIGRMSSRWVVKILKREGRHWAEASQTYETETGKVREFRACLLRADGSVKKYGKAETVDISLAANDVYNQARRKVISAEADAEPGTVFGYESVHEDRSIFVQYEWFFQSRLPVVVSRFKVALPPGWSANAMTFNYPAVEPAVGPDRSYTWEVKGLKYLDEQPMMPALVDLVPRLAVNIVPGAGASHAKTFANWNDVACWIWQLAEPQRQTDAALSAKANDLTKDSAGEFDKLRAIARFAQSVNYVSIQTGIGRGGGYTPHLASDVLAKSYGDCKDKANLMRSLLSVINIDSYPVAVYASDRNYVRPDWPSPQQFNHAIIAVKVSEAVTAPTVIVHPELGRLLLFDPTNEHTPLGDIPENLQGSFALIAHKDSTSLVKIPVLGEEQNHLERTVQATISPTGMLKATIAEKSTGQAAVHERALYKGQRETEYKKDIERWVAGAIGGAQITRLECRDDLDTNGFNLEVELSGDRYGQLMQNRLLIFRPALLSRREGVSFMEGERRHPIEIEPAAFIEHCTVRLPDGFAIDELPESVKLETAFGSYEAVFEAEGATLKLHRHLILKPTFLEAGKYSEVKGFFDRISTAEQAPAVLIRK